MENVEVAYTVIAFTDLNIISSTIYVFLRSYGQEKDTIP